VEGRKRASQPRRLSSHVPVRFDGATIDAVKRFAVDDGMTVSAWIRALVDREVQWRLARVTYTAHEQMPFSFEMLEGPPTNVTSTSAPLSGSAA
jgi:hypothetical protein